MICRVNLMLETATIHDDAALAELAAEWWRLWEGCPAATPFQSPAWLLSWWQAFHPGELCVATARRDGRLIGLAPFYLASGSQGGRLLPLGIATSDYLDILIDPACRDEAAAALSRQISKALPSWQEWELTELPPSAAARHLPCPEECEEVIEPASTCCGLSVQPNCRDAASILSTSRRRKLRMARHRAARRGELCVLVADQSNVAALVGEMVRLNRLRRSQGNLSESVFADPRLVAFHHAVAPQFLAAGILRLCALLIGSRLAAVYYGFQHRGRAYAYLGGFDPAFASESPGKLLFAHVIDTAMAEGMTELDLLRGKEAYKSDWGAVPRTNSRRLFRRRVLRHAAA